MEYHIIKNGIKLSLDDNILFMDSLIPKDFEYSWGVWLVVTLGLVFLLCCFLWRSVKKTR